ncbi:arylesterase [Penaeicola halotolerans]|uniref:arylesterase n=1 Tax=Penaeicola halotolerans TaxID=2793196 RepID=UPI001CF8BC65|nr:arylesterase [Penaeicola halotolerans]
MRQTLHNILLLVFFAGLLACGSASDSTDSTQAPVAPEASETDISNEEIADTRPRIVFFGNSLTAAYGLDKSEGFAGLIQVRLDSLGYDYQVVNAGLSGETTAGGVTRVDWVLENPLEIFVLELGGNDGLRGIATEETYKNLKQIISKVRAKYPETKILLAGMQVPPNMGTEYSTDFAAIYPKVAKEMNVALIPFLLENVGGIKELNLPDGIHPTAEGHKIVLENIWPYLKPLL